MNWHLSRLGLAALFCVAVFCLLLFLVFGFFGGDFVALLDCAQVLYQFTLEVPQSVDGHVCALIN